MLYRIVENPRVITGIESSPASCKRATVSSTVNPDWWAIARISLAERECSHRAGEALLDAAKEPVKPGNCVYGRHLAL